MAGPGGAAWAQGANKFPNHISCAMTTFVCNVESGTCIARSPARLPTHVSHGKEDRVWQGVPFEFLCARECIGELDKGIITWIVLFHNQLVETWEFLLHFILQPNFIGSRFYQDLQNRVVWQGWATMVE